MQRILRRQLVYWHRQKHDVRTLCRENKKKAGPVTDIVTAAYENDDDRVGRVMEKFGADQAPRNTTA